MVSVEWNEDQSTIACWYKKFHQHAKPFKILDGISSSYQSVRKMLGLNLRIDLNVIIWLNYLFTM